MGLFDKKYCDVCGAQIGLLGVRKLDDGMICKDCNNKLSPFFTGRKKSALEDIKAQLAYREENKARLGEVVPSVTVGSGMKLYLDKESRRFVATRSSNWRNVNPDIISFDQVTDVKINVEEDEEELFDKDANGNEVSFNPPKYEYEYSFDVELSIDSPWFSSVSFELSDGRRPDSKSSEGYKTLVNEANELLELLAPGKEKLVAQTAEEETQAGADNGAVPLVSTVTVESANEASGDIVLNGVDYVVGGELSKIFAEGKFCYKIVDEAKFANYKNMGVESMLQQTMNTALANALAKLSELGVSADALSGHVSEMFYSVSKELKDSWSGLFGVEPVAFSLSKFTVFKAQ